MKIYFLLMSVALVTTFSFCSKSNDGPGGSCNLPSTAVPQHLVGNWANGYNSSTQIVDAYSGQYVGNAFQNGKYFHFEGDGKNAVFYYMVYAGTTSSSATKVSGTVEFLDDASFIFHGCKGHYKGWRNGQLTIDRDAADSEVQELLTQKYYYEMVTLGNTTYMQIKFEPNQTTGTSFRKVQ